MNRLLFLQYLYLGMGLIFNALSHTLMEKSDQGLTPTDPLQGSIILVAYGMFLLFGFCSRKTIYRILMLAAMLVLGYGGVIRHTLQWQENAQLYFSFYVMIMAVLINLFGLILNGMAVLGKFVDSNDE